METWIALLLPFALLLARITAFFSALPLFGWRALPVVVRAGLSLMVTIFLATIQPPAEIASGQTHWLAAALLLIRELLCGLALGLAVRFIFMAVQLGGRMGSRQMGIADAGIIDPSSGERERPVSTLLGMVFAMFFLSVGGHRLLLQIIVSSYKMFPVGAAPDPAGLAEGLVEAGSVMFFQALKLAAPLMAAFLILAVVLGVLARALPEMHIRMAAFPLRMGLGLLMASALVPLLESFTYRLAGWMSKIVIQ